MALTATLHRFNLEIADIDRSVYESLDLRVAQHPSEDEERLVVRVLARAIAHHEQLDFGRGLSNVEDPALVQTSLTGNIECWIDVGIPSADRLHRASKRADKVMVFTHKLEVALRKEWSSRSIHQADAIELLRLDPSLVKTLAEGLTRTTTWYITLQDGTISVAQGDQNLSAPLVRQSLADFLSAAEG